QVTGRHLITLNESGPSRPCSRGKVRPVADPRRSPAAAKLSRNHPLECGRFQIFLPDIGFLFQLIGQYQQVPVNQCASRGLECSPLAAGVLPSGGAVEHESRVKYLLLVLRPWMVVAPKQTRM